MKIKSVAARLRSRFLKAFRRLALQPEVLPAKSDYQPTQISKMPHPNIYIQMLPEYRGWIFLEEEACSLKGRWAGVFGDPQLPVDLEIGCGNGFFLIFSSYCAEWFRRVFSSCS